MLIENQQQKVRPKSMQNTSRGQAAEVSKSGNGIQTQRSTANPNVFISLYEIAQTRKEKSIDVQKEAQRV